MLFNPAHERRFSRAPHAELASPLAAALLKRLPNDCKPGTRERVERLLTAGAPTDAALILIACELPQWQMCRLMYDDGE